MKSGRKDSNRSALYGSPARDDAQIPVVYIVRKTQVAKVVPVSNPEGPIGLDLPLASRCVASLCRVATTSLDVFGTCGSWALTEGLCQVSSRWKQ